MIHEYGPDYGIDCVVELFDYIDEAKEVAETLGEHFYVQLKASESVHYTTRRAHPRGNVAKGKLSEDKAEYIDIPVANFQLDVSDLLTVELLGPAVPVLLILVDIQTERAFFVCLNDYLEKVILPEDPAFLKRGLSSFKFLYKMKYCRETSIWFRLGRMENEQRCTGRLRASLFRERRLREQEV